MLHTRSNGKYSAALSAMAVLWLVCLAALSQPQVTLAWYRPVVIGHRGSSQGVENTLPAIQHAIEAGADYVEVDVCLSRDGELVVFHDDTLQRLAGAEGSVGDYSAAQLSRLRLQQNGFTGSIPTLSQVLEHCKTQRMRVIIEMNRGGDEALLVHSLGQFITEGGYDDGCVVMGQKPDMLYAMKSSFPNVAISYCRYGDNPALSAEQLLAAGMEFMVVEAGKADQELIDDIQAVGIPVFVCTVNKSGDIRAFFDMGAAGIVTDNPASAAGVITQMKDEHSESKT